MEIQGNEIVLQYVRLDIGKDSLNIVGVNSRCKMIVNGSVAISLHTQKHCQNELVNVLDRSRIAFELWIVCAYVALSGQDFRFEQVGFVEKQNYRNAGKGRIVHDRVEYIL